MKVINKVIVVTGAGGGVGREIVMQLLKKNARVAAVDINENALNETNHRALPLGSRLTTHVSDISDRESVTKLVYEVIREHVHVDGIINNAGIIHSFIPFNHLDYATIDRIIDVNLYGVVHITKAFLPHLVRQPEAHIANVSSLGGLFAFTNQSIYGVTKAGVKALSESLYIELRSTNVDVSVIFPGAIRTNITQNSGVRNEKLENLKKLFLVSRPEIVARRIISSIEKRQFCVHIGIDAKILGFLNRINSKWAILAMDAVLRIALSK